MQSAIFPGVFLPQRKKISRYIFCFFTERTFQAERLSQSENGLPLRQICYYSPPEEVGVFSTEIKNGQNQ